MARSSYREWFVHFRFPLPRIRPPRPLAFGRNPTGLGGEEPLGRSITRVLVERRVVLVSDIMRVKVLTGSKVRSYLTGVGKGLKDLKHRVTKDTERKEEVLKALCSL